MKIYWLWHDEHDRRMYKIPCKYYANYMRNNKTDIIITVINYYDSFKVRILVCKTERNTWLIALFVSQAFPDNKSEEKDTLCVIRGDKNIKFRWSSKVMLQFTSQSGVTRRYSNRLGDLNDRHSFGFGRRFSTEAI